MATRGWETAKDKRDDSRADIITRTGADVGAGSYIRIRTQIYIASETHADADSDRVWNVKRGLWRPWTVAIWAQFPAKTRRHQRYPSPPWQRDAE